MNRPLTGSRLPIALLLALAVASNLTAAESFRSHPPTRALPQPSRRPLGAGPLYFVDAGNGNDEGPGTKEAPWKTVQHGVTRLNAGDTLVVREGTYYEQVTINRSGDAAKPITIRSMPGELAVLDSGIREFYEAPAAAWEPYSEGSAGEFRSTKAYKQGGGFGNFGDSMVPLQRCLTFHDLRSHNELWHTGLNNRANDPIGIYAGPGVRRDPETGRIHIRLAHTRLAGLGKRHYRGETDPRQLPLVIAGGDYALTIAGAKNVRIQDLVVRGAERSAVWIAESENIELTGMTLYGAGSALRTSKVTGLRLANSALRGHAAPWHSRGHHKDRAGAGYLAVADGNDFEFAHCEFSDHHDGLLMKDVGELRFHHNLVDRFNDDGLEPGPKQRFHRILIYENVITRCLNTFTAHGNPNPVESEPGSGVYIYRNVIDLRRGLYMFPPREPDSCGAFLNHIGSVCSDHGSPTWAVYFVYHNTFLLPTDSWRNYYAFGWGSHMAATKRRVFNNIFLQIEGAPGLNFQAVSPEDDFRADGNLLWGVNDGLSRSPGFFAEFRGSAKFERSKERHPPGWGAHDLFADPMLVSLGGSSDDALDVRLRPDSPAVDAGVELPATWPDALRAADKGKPDIGALPLGVEPLKVGPHRHPGLW